MQATIRQKASSSGYVPVSIGTLLPSSVLGVPLYLRSGDEGPPQLYKGADYRLDADDLERLRGSGASTLYIRTIHCSQYHQYLRTHLDQVINDRSASVGHRLNVLNLVAGHVLNDVFGRRDADGAVAESTKLASQIVCLLGDEDFVAGHLRSVLYHDYHTFTHSANVAYFSVVLARASGRNETDELKQIAAGGLLHDIGKLRIADAILNKPGRLDEREMEAMQLHPTYGFKIVCRRPDVSFGQLMMVYQHHERLDGKGYPVGSVTDELHPWARICSVADVFEALTSNRPYRPAMPLEQALGVLERQSGVAFDEELIQCWTNLFASQPPANSR